MQRMTLKMTVITENNIKKCFGTKKLAIVFIQSYFSAKTTFAISICTYITLKHDANFLTGSRRRIIVNLFHLETRQGQPASDQSYM